jgi:hypothetical protein
MGREFEIHVQLDVNLRWGVYAIKDKIETKDTKALDSFTNVVFDSAKHCVGVIFSEHNIHKIHGWGKHSDAVRVYSALKNNKYNIIYTKGV